MIFAVVAVLLGVVNGEGFGNLSGWRNTTSVTSANLRSAPFVGDNAELEDVTSPKWLQFGYYGDAECKSALLRFSVIANTCVKIENQVEYVKWKYVRSSLTNSWEASVYSDKDCSNLAGVYPGLNTFPSTCTEVDGGIYVVSKATTFAREEYYVAGVLSNTYVNAATCAEAAQSLDDVKLLESVFLGINLCANLAATGGYDARVVYCSGNQMTVNVYSSTDGSCDGSLVGITNLFANQNCANAGTTAVGYAYGGNSFSCVAASV